MNNFLSALFYGVEPGFVPAIQQAANAVRNKAGIFSGDNLFTLGRNLSFLADQPFFEAWQKHARTPAEQACIWRIAVLAWAARTALRGSSVPGDFVECACYKGTSARVVCDTVNFAATGRRYYLYDLFDHDPSMPHHAMPEHSRKLYAETVARFADVAGVIVTQGKVPDVLHEVAPERIAFLHLDLNNATAELAALEFLFDRVSPGGVIVFDDYGWLAYRAQKLAEDPWLAARGYHVLELPTGQGLLIK
ncbi:MAG TPA: class I SAM-dependent methyltransferase [Hyphomicrobiaceae bacterium]|nr:class I SAM-dependent methyltransferase [Hyphomicrobiaceae bacterium]